MLRARRRRGRRRRRRAHAVRGAPARVRARARRHDERRGGQHAAQDARGAAVLRRPAAAHRPPEPGAADDRLALPDRALRPARRRRRSPQRLQSRGVAPDDRARVRAARRSATRERALALGSATARRCAPPPRRSRARRSPAAPRGQAVARRCSAAGAERGRRRARASSRRRATRSSQFLPKKEQRKRATRRTTSASSAPSAARRTGARRPRRCSSPGCGSATSPASPPARPTSPTTPTAPPSSRADAAGRDARPLREAVELVEDTRARLRSTSARTSRCEALAYRLERLLRVTEVRVRGAHATVRADGLDDEVAVEEPLEIRVDGRALAVTMRTPGPRRGARARLPVRRGADRRRRAPPARPPTWPATRSRSPGPLLREPAARSFYTTSSCGVCGKGALEEVAVHAEPLPDGPGRRARAAGRRCPTGCASRASSAPAACTRPGCSTPAGELLLRARGRRPPQRDGQGRRPGAAATACCRCTRTCCASAGGCASSSSRRPCVAGAPVLVGVGAPTSLAVRLADDRGLTLCGLRPRRARERLHAQRARRLSDRAGGGALAQLAAAARHRVDAAPTARRRRRGPPSGPSRRRPCPVSSTWKASASRSSTSSSRSRAPSGSARSASTCSATRGSPAGPETISSRRLMAPLVTPISRRSVLIRRSDREPRSRETRKIGRARGRGSRPSRSSAGRARRRGRAAAASAPRCGSRRSTRRRRARAPANSSSVASASSGASTSQNGCAQTATPPAAWMTSIASATVGRLRAT